MRPLDWIVLVTSLASIIAYGLYRSRGSNTVDRYLLAGKSMPWYAMALSIMATQASARAAPTVSMMINRSLTLIGRLPYVIVGHAFTSSRSRPS